MLNTKVFKITNYNDLHTKIIWFKKIIYCCITTVSFHIKFVRRKSSSSSSSITLYDCLLPDEPTFSRWVSKNSSTVSVFHLVMERVSLTLPFLSSSLTIGSKPRTYLMVKLGNFAGRPLLMNAWICGYARNLQVHTSSIALG